MDEPRVPRLPPIDPEAHEAILEGRKLLREKFGVGTAPEHERDVCTVVLASAAGDSPTDALSPALATVLLNGKLAGGKRQPTPREMHAMVQIALLFCAVFGVPLGIALREVAWVFKRAADTVEKLEGKDDHERT